MVTLNGEKLYKCLLCGKTFTRPYRIQRHLQVHNPSRSKVQCHLCGKQFTRVDTLQTHIRCVHTNDRPFACTFEGCDKRFPVQSGLVHHLKVTKIAFDIVLTINSDLRNHLVAKQWSSMEQYNAFSPN